MTPDRIAEALGGLIPPKRHAAELAADALHRALGSAAAEASLAPDPRRTLVAMSGGVDSAAAAQLALDAGDEVVAVTLELWSDPATDGERSCCSPQAVTGARALAHRMGIPHITLDLRERFRAEVVDRFIEGYTEGRTPNPCVSCNGHVRFDAMLELAERLGAARLATGHYARIARDEQGPLIRAASDPRKDQSYMLAKLDPAQLDRLSFPLGGLTKDSVRALAREAGLPVADKRESQDLCFVAGLGGRAFLQRHGGPRLRRPGEIVDATGRVLGHHDGQHEFTVGQRRGLNVERRRAALRHRQGRGHQPRDRRSARRAGPHDGAPRGRPSAPPGRRREAGAAALPRPRAAVPRDRHAPAAGSSWSSPSPPTRWHPGSWPA